MTNPSLDLAFEWLQNSEKKCDMDQEKWNEIKNQTKRVVNKVLLPKDYILFEPFIS